MRLEGARELAYPHVEIALFKTDTLPGEVEGEFALVSLAAEGLAQVVDGGFTPVEEPIFNSSPALAADNTQNRLRRCTQHRGSSEAGERVSRKRRDSPVVRERYRAH